MSSLDQQAGSESDQAEAPKSAKDELIDIAKTIAYALAIALVLRIFLFQPFTIPSASMEPNLYEGDYIIVTKWNYGYSRYSAPFGLFPAGDGRIFGAGPERGDVVVFKLPSDNKTDYIKRVIGLPGDRIQVRQNTLYINDQPVQDAAVGTLEITNAYQSIQALQVRETLPDTGRTFMTQDFGPDGRLDDTETFLVPDGHYFMMGDNRDNSIDSRVPQGAGGVGFVPARNLVGEAELVLLSWKPGASIFKPWTWFTHLRPSRMFKPLS